MVAFEKEGEGVAVVEQRALDWHLDNFAGQRELEGLFRREVRHGIEVEVVTVEVEL